MQMVKANPSLASHARLIEYHKYMINQLSEHGSSVGDSLMDMDHFAKWNRLMLNQETLSTYDHHLNS